MFNIAVLFAANWDEQQWGTRVSACSEDGIFCLNCHVIVGWYRQNQPKPCHIYVKNYCMTCNIVIILVRLIFHHTEYFWCSCVKCISSHKSCDKMLHIGLHNVRCMMNVAHHENWQFLNCVRFQVLTEVSMKTTAFWDIAPCSLVEVDQNFRCDYCLRNQIEVALITSEMAVFFYKTARCNIPEGCCLQFFD
jgi:hypothetical protein